MTDTSQRHQCKWLYKYLLVLLCVKQTNPEYIKIKDEFVRLLVVNLSTKKEENFDSMKFILLLYFCGMCFFTVVITLLTPSAIIDDFEYGFSKKNLEKFLIEEHPIKTEGNSVKKEQIDDKKSIRSNSGDSFDDNSNYYGDYNLDKKITKVIKFDYLIIKQSIVLKKSFPDFHFIRVLVKIVGSFITSFNEQLGFKFSKFVKQEKNTEFFMILIGGNKKLTVEVEEDNDDDSDNYSVNTDLNEEETEAVNQLKSELKENKLSKEEIDKGIENLNKLDFVETIFKSYVDFSKEKTLENIPYGCDNSDYDSDGS